MDDHKDIRDLLGEILTDFGFSVYSAVNGLDALEQMKAKPKINLVLTDIKTLTTSGISLLTKLTGMDFQKYGEVYFITANELEDDLSQLPIHGTITKPFYPDEIYDLLKKTYRRK